METQTPSDQDNGGSVITVPDPDGPPDPPTDPAGDPSAPYGLKADGTPRKKPGPPPGTKTGAAARPAAPRAKKTAAKKGQPDYRPAIGGALQMIGLPLAALGARDDRFLADAVALGEHAEPIVEAVNDLAQDNPAIARVLDKLAQVGPYGMLIGALSPLFVQIAANHEALPGPLAASLGAVEPSILVAKVKAEAAQYGPPPATPERPAYNPQDSRTW
jgi:hypothetical protein